MWLTGFKITRVGLHKQAKGKLFQIANSFQLINKKFRCAVCDMNKQTTQPDNNTTIKKFSFVEIKKIIITKQ